MEELLGGLVPGLPPSLREQILARAEGVPLYAVETVRMLLDRGLLVQEGSVYRPVGQIETLEVPETLQALIAARLDGVSPEERRLLQDGAVFGKTFTRQALAAIAGVEETQLESPLAGLVRKEVLAVQADPRSPERGQYGFLQDLVRRVAYETLSKRERKLRHLAAAAYLESAFPEPDEIAEVLASHYLAAVDAAPEAEDADAIRGSAREMFARAGRRAASLGAPEEGQRYFAQAATLAGDAPVEAELLEQAGRLGLMAGLLSEGRLQLERAISLFEEVRDEASESRVSSVLAEIDIYEGRLEQAIARLEAALVALEQAGPSAELAETLAQLGRIEALHGERERAVPKLEQALRLAEQLRLDEVFVQALISKGLGLLFEGRLAEAEVLLAGALERARAGEVHAAWFRAANNLEALDLMRQAEAQARQLGDREELAARLAGSATLLLPLGRWGEALALAGEAAELQASEWSRAELIETAIVRCE